MRVAGRVALLTALWLLAWGDVSLANVLSGVVVSGALLAAVPPSAAGAVPARIGVLSVVRLVGFVAVQLVTSNLVMIREVLRPRPAIRPGVLAHRLRHPSEHVVTVMTSVISLSPGTMTVDVDESSRTIYVHFLFLDDLAAARAGLERLERLAAGAVDPQRRASTPEAA